MYNIVWVVFGLIFECCLQEKAGKEWSLKFVMWVKDSQENHPNLKDSFAQWYASYLQLTLMP